MITFTNPPVWEFWINVFANQHGYGYGHFWGSKEAAIMAANRSYPYKVIYRIHVKMKQ